MATNFNAILGRYKPASMGFDVCHLNLHKTFSTPRTAARPEPDARPGGRRRTAAAVPADLRVIKRTDGAFALDYDYPKSIGYVALRQFRRARADLRPLHLMIGREGLRAVSNHAVLNANYLLGSCFAANCRPCMHEFVLSASIPGKPAARAPWISPKALIDRSIHLPTVYFPLIVPEAMMVEAHGNQTRETLDRFAEVMAELAEIARTNSDALHAARTTKSASWMK